MSGLNDWLDLSGAQQMAILQEDLEERLAARRRRDAERALKFAPLRTTPLSILDPPAKNAVSLPWAASTPPDAGGSKSLPKSEHIACTR
jgi:hypothetical protein